jgi:hypothetical protein
MKLLKQKGNLSLKPLISRPQVLPDQSLSTSNLNSNDFRKLSPELSSPMTPKQEPLKLFNYLSHEPFLSLSPNHDSSKSRPTRKSPPIDPYQPKSGHNKLIPGQSSNVEQLETWLEKMKETHLPELESIIRKNLVPRSDITKKVEDIFSIALNEIVKQVTAQNRLRGELLEKVLNTLRYVWSKYPQHLNFLLEKEKDFFEKSFQEIEVKYQTKIEKHKQRSRVFQIKMKKLEDEKDMLVKELVILRKSASDYRSEVSQLVKTA